jgi:hypothetical protein
MGTDITAFLEKRVDGVWVPAQRIIDKARPGEFPWLAIHPDDELEISRSYTLFALLAGVRNRDNLTPIAPLRGLPDDISDQIRALAKDELEMGAGSTTFYTISELIEYDWSKQLIYAEGYVSEAEDARLAATNYSVLPQSWRYAAEPGYEKHAIWVTAAQENFTRFLSHFLPSLVRFGAPHDLRLIIMFD